MDPKYTHTLGLMAATIYAARNSPEEPSPDREYNIERALDDAYELLRAVIACEV